MDQGRATSNMLTNPQRGCWALTQGTHRRKPHARSSQSLHGTQGVRKRDLAFQGAKDSVGGSRLCRRSSHRFLKQRSRNGSPRQVSTRMLSASKVEVPVRLRHDGRVELPARRQPCL
eukprot:378822-Pleurochrysis_carterae.AAC.2